MNPQISFQPAPFQRLTPKAVVPHFGLSLSKYRDVFEGQDEFTRYGEFNPAQSEALSSERENFYYDTKVTELASPEDTEKYLKAGQLGIIEEAGDIVFEYTLLSALKKGLITEDVVNTVLKKLVAPALESKERPLFTDLLDEILLEIPEQSQQQFIKMIGSFNPKKAKQLLALGVFKYAVFKHNDANYPMMDATRGYLFGEIEELQENLEHSRLKGKKLTAAYRFADKFNLSVKATMIYPKTLVSAFFKTQFSSRELLKYAFIKQMGRQEFNYLHPDMTYNERKSHYKFKEAILEASFLKRKGLVPQ